MTTEEIRQRTAGIMGWYSDPLRGQCYLDKKGEVADYVADWHPNLNWKQALKVADKLLVQGWTLSLFRGTTGNVAQFKELNTGRMVEKATGFGQGPLAICLATIEAVDRKGKP